MPDIFLLRYRFDRETTLEETCCDEFKEESL